MSERTILSINAPNIITIMLMVAIGQCVVMLLRKAFQSRMATQATKAAA